GLGWSLWSLVLVLRWYSACGLRLRFSFYGETGRSPGQASKRPNPHGSTVWPARREGPPEASHRFSPSVLADLSGYLLPFYTSSIPAAFPPVRFLDPPPPRSVPAGCVAAKASLP